MEADAVYRLRAAFKSGKTRPYDWRVAQLKALDRMLREEMPKFAEACAADLGQPKFECVNVQVSPLLSDIATILAALPDFVSEKSLPTPLVMAPASTTASYEPKGVVLIMGPWNFAIGLVLQPLAAALAAGNCALLKPSESAPACSALLAAVVPKYLDPDCIAVVLGGVRVAKGLLAQKFDHIFFTGGGAIGTEVYKAAAAQLTPCTLELGGTNLAYVHDDLDPALVARRLCHGAFSNAGQICLGLDTALVHENMLPKLLPQLRKTVREWYGDEPKESSSLARLVSEASTQRVAAMLAPASHGGEVLVGGTVDTADRYVSPTIVVSPKRGCPLLEHETFGPVLVLLPVSGVAEAIEFSADRPTALCKYVFARSTAVANEYLASVRAGMACVNDTMFQGGNPAVPFGGFGPSGFGAYHGIRGAAELSHYTGVLRQPSLALFDPPFRYPPYTEQKTKLLAFVLATPLPAWLLQLFGAMRRLLLLGGCCAASFYIGLQWQR